MAPLAFGSSSGLDSAIDRSNHTHDHITNGTLATTASSSDASRPHSLATLILIILCTVVGLFCLLFIVIRVIIWCVDRGARKPPQQAGRTTGIELSRTTGGNQLSNNLQKPRQGFPQHAAAPTVAPTASSVTTAAANAEMPTELPPVYSAFWDRTGRQGTANNASAAAGRLSSAETLDEPLPAYKES